MIGSPASREALLHVVKNLPAAPRILAQLGQLLLEPNSDLTDVVGLLKHDTALTARVIRVSNSAVYGSGSRAGSLDEALLRVGFNEVYRLVGLAAVSQLSDDSLQNYGISGVRFRENSLFVAFVVEVLAPRLDLDPRSAYTAGLLRSTGKIAIDRLVPGPMRTRSYGNIGNSRPIAEWELDVVGMDNSTAAATVLDEWRFPALTSSSIRHHYVPASTSPLSKLLNVACGLTEKAGYPLPGEQSYWTAAADPQVADWDLENAVVIARGQFERARQAIG